MASSSTGEQWCQRDAGSTVVSPASLRLVWPRNPNQQRQVTFFMLALEALKTIIANQAAAAEALKPLETVPREGEEVDLAIDEVFDTVQVPPGVGEGALRRENWYR